MKNKAALWLSPEQVAYFEQELGQADSATFKALLLQLFPDMPKDKQSGNPNFGKELPRQKA